MSTAPAAPASAAKPVPPYRLPAEWEPQAALWLSWPVSTHIWPGKGGQIGDKFGEIAAAVSRFQTVCINAAGAAHAGIREFIDRHNPVWENVRLLDQPTNDVWCRDHGPVFVKDAQGQTVVTDWEFNAWGGKFRPYDLDNSLPQRLAAGLGLPRLAEPAILEGGAIDSNGQGVMLTTDPVLLNPNRNPQLSRADYEARFAEVFGLSETVWLPGVLANDDTDGHVDNLARFVAPDTVLAVRDAENLPELEDNFRILSERFSHVIALPNPDRVLNADGEELPASYANFLIINDAVLLPVFGQERKDAEATAILQKAFPERSIVAIDCRLLLEEGGALHCISCNQPL